MQRDKGNENVFLKDKIMTNYLKVENGDNETRDKEETLELTQIVLYTTKNENLE